MSREFGVTPVYLDSKCSLFKGIPTPSDVLMSHGDSVLSLPGGFEIAGTTKKPVENVVRIEVAAGISQSQRKTLEILYPNITIETLADLPEGFMVEKDYILTIES